MQAVVQLFSILVFTDYFFSPVIAKKYYNNSSFTEKHILFSYLVIVPILSILSSLIFAIFPITHALFQFVLFFLLVHLFIILYKRFKYNYDKKDIGFLIRNIGRGILYSFTLIFVLFNLLVIIAILIEY